MPTSTCPELPEALPDFPLPAFRAGEGPQDSGSRGSWHGSAGASPRGGFSQQRQWEIWGPEKREGAGNELGENVQETS